MLWHIIFKHNLPDKKKDCQKVMLIAKSIKSSHA